MRHYCPECRSIVPILLRAGDAIANCRWCGPQLWRAVFAPTPKLVIYAGNRNFHGGRPLARLNRRADRRLLPGGGAW